MKDEDFEYLVERARGFRVSLCFNTSARVVCGYSVFSELTGDHYQSPIFDRGEEFVLKDASRTLDRFLSSLYATHVPELVYLYENESEINHFCTAPKWAEEVIYSDKGGDHHVGWVGMGKMQSIGSKTPVPFDGTYGHRRFVAYKRKISLLSAAPKEIVAPKGTVPKNSPCVPRPYVPPIISIPTPEPHTDFITGSLFVQYLPGVRQIAIGNSEGEFAIVDVKDIKDLTNKLCYLEETLDRGF